MILEPLSPRVASRFWHRGPDGTSVCDVCPRTCALPAGHEGVCGVRAGSADGVVFTRYGRTSGFSVEPIEARRLYHVLPGVSCLSVGTAGRALTCPACEAPAPPLDHGSSPEFVASAAQALGCAVVGFDGGDPAILHEFAMDVALACRARGLRTVLSTAGYVSAGPRAELYRAADAVGVELYSFSETWYAQVGGHLGPVLETIAYVRGETSAMLEVSVPLVTGENDSARELDEMTSWLAREVGRDVPVHFRVRGSGLGPTTSYLRARQIALANGLLYVYTPPVEDAAMQSTDCPACGLRVVERQAGRVTAYRLDAEGGCQCCGARCPGLFAEPPAAGPAVRVREGRATSCCL